MKKISAIICFIIVSMTVLAQEPANNLGKRWTEVQKHFPDAVNTGPVKGEDGDLWMCFDEDEFQTYVYYFNVRDGKVFSESMMVDPTGKIENAGYFFFIISIQNYYNRGGWEECDVDASILGAANIFRKEHRLVWADSYEADFDFSDFWVYFQYNQEKGYSMMTFYPRQDEQYFEI